MRLSELKSIITNAVKHSLNESPTSKVSSFPKTFRDFRTKLGAALQKSKAPSNLVEEIKDLDFEGGDAFTSMWRTWETWQEEMKEGEGADLVDTWNDFVSTYVKDCVVDMLDDCGASERFDRTKVSVDVVKSLLSVVAPDQSQINHKKLRNMADFVTDVLENCTSVNDVKWNGKDSTITYSMRSDIVHFLDEIDTICMEAGMKPTLGNNPDGGPSDTWHDEMTGLKVHFGDGAATIS